jgi:hypothetical protein
MKFKKWLVEFEDKGFNYYKNMLLGKLSLDPNHGLDQGLDAWQPEQLISTLEGLGEFKELPADIQNQVVGQIKSRLGTLGDLVRLMSNPSPNIGDVE